MVTWTIVATTGTIYIHIGNHWHNRKYTHICQYIHIYIHTHIYGYLSTTFPPSHVALEALGASNSASPSADIGTLVNTAIDSIVGWQCQSWFNRWYAWDIPGSTSNSRFCSVNNDIKSNNNGFNMPSTVTRGYQNLLIDVNRPKKW